MPVGGAAAARLQGHRRMVRPEAFAPDGAAAASPGHHAAAAVVAWRGPVDQAGDSRQSGPAVIRQGAAGMTKRDWVVAASMARHLASDAAESAATAAAAAPTDRESRGRIALHALPAGFHRQRS